MIKMPKFDHFLNVLT